MKRSRKHTWWSTRHVPVLFAQKTVFNLTWKQFTNLMILLFPLSTTHYRLKFKSVFIILLRMKFFFNSSLSILKIPPPTWAHDLCSHVHLFNPSHHTKVFLAWFHQNHIQNDTPQKHALFIGRPSIKIIFVGCMFNKNRFWNAKKIKTKLTHHFTVKPVYVNYGTK